VYDVEKPETALQDVKNWKKAVDDSVEVAPIFVVIANKCDDDKPYETDEVEEFCSAQKIKL